MLTGGGDQAVMQAMGSGCKYRGSFAHLPTTHLLLCVPVLNRPHHRLVPVHGPGIGGSCYRPCSQQAVEVEFTARDACTELMIF